MLTSAQFGILSQAMQNRTLSQRDYADALGISLGQINKTIKELLEMGLLDGEGLITEAGKRALQPYKVDNAVIMAAGFSSRFAPISYERPKGVLTVRGEVLIERQIRQLQEAGIHDITVVVGYKKEEFFYLEDLLGVSIVINDEYATRNNNSTIHKVQNILGNTYICSSDDYFTENPFEPYVYESYYSAVFEEGETDEYCLTTRGKDDQIIDVSVGGENSWVMLGHVYWSRSFSERFVEILNRVYDSTETFGKLWEDIYRDHIKELPMVMRRYPRNVIWEFDSLEELKEFDPAFIENLDSSIFANICKVLNCSNTDIQDIVPISQGLTNLSFRFSVAGKLYVYRHPGAGTDKIINRACEAFSQGIAKKLGIDDTFIFEDGKTGWKISQFIPDCEPFDYHNPDHVRRGLALIRKLHTCGVQSEWTFDLFEKALEIVSMLKESNKASFADFNEMMQTAEAINGFLQAEGVPLCLCHNDFYEPNFLVRGDLMYLIDWEYSAMSDYASDLGTFICCSDYTVDEAKDIIAQYFDGNVSADQMRHCLSFVAIAAYYWFVWAIYKETTGDPVGEWLYLWYRASKTYGRLSLELWQGAK